MRSGLRFAAVFAIACIAGVYVHELGHAVAGWVQGVSVFPTPLKEYVLQEQVEWRQQIWIALGGVAGTALVMLGALGWYLRARRQAIADAILAGAFLPSFLYAVRFLLAGRGHDGLEWQEAQSALGVAPFGHTVDMLLLGLLLAGISVWLVHRRRSWRWSSLIKAAGLMLAGVVLLVFLQVGNNALFDRYFPTTVTVNAPEGFEYR